MTDTVSQVVPGAESISVAGGPLGALALHGFTGSPATVRPVADAFVEAGWTVEAPRLPGHGTSVEDMKATGWDDWYGEARAALDRLRSATERQVVFGLSMGGALACRLAIDVGGISALVVANPAVQPPHPTLVEMAEQALAEGTDELPGIASDIAKPDVTELAYRETAIGPALSLFAAQEVLAADLDRIDCPVLILTSPNDHVVDPEASDLLAGAVAGPVTRVSLDRSYHVATLDWDAELVRAEAVSFARRHAEVAPA